MHSLAGMENHIRSVIILLALLAGMRTRAQQVLISEQFDAYSQGDLLVATLGLPWVTWTSNALNDVPLSAEQAYSGTLSARFVSGNSTGGPGDVILRLGEPTTGRYKLEWRMFIHPGLGGYFNLLHSQTNPFGSWAMDITFLGNGTLLGSTNVNLLNTSFAHGAWLHVELLIDLDTQVGELLIDGVQTATWPTNLNYVGQPSPNRLGGLNFYAYGGGGIARYFVDDVQFTDLNAVGVPESAPPAPALHPMPTTGPLTLTIPEHMDLRTISLCDALGRELDVPLPALHNAVGLVQLDLSTLPVGTYLLRMRTSQGVVVARVLRSDG